MWLNEQLFKMESNNDTLQTNTSFTIWNSTLQTNTSFTIWNSTSYNEFESSLALEEDIMAYTSYIYKFFVIWLPVATISTWILYILIEVLWLGTFYVIGYIIYKCNPNAKHNKYFLMLNCNVEDYLHTCRIGIHKRDRNTGYLHTV